MAQKKMVQGRKGVVWSISGPVWGLDELLRDIKLTCTGVDFQGRKKKEYRRIEWKVHECEKCKDAMGGSNAFLVAKARSFRDWFAYKEHMKQAHRLTVCRFCDALSTADAFEGHKAECPRRQTGRECDCGQSFKTMTKFSNHKFGG